MSLTTSEINFLLTVSDVKKIPTETVHMNAPISELSEVISLTSKGYLNTKEGSIVLSSHGENFCRIAKSGLNFKTILHRCNFKALTAFFNKYIEVAFASGFHINVVLKNLPDNLFNYVKEEYEEALAKRNASLESSEELED